MSFVSEANRPDGPYEGREAPSSRAWEAIPGEFDIAVNEVIGALPAELTGTLYRNGSGRWDVGSTAIDCIFDTDGMVSAFILDGSCVRRGHPTTLSRKPARLAVVRSICSSRVSDSPSRPPGPTSFFPRR